jgi:hypothetical protein
LYLFIFLVPHNKVSFVRVRNYRLQIFSFYFQNLTFYDTFIWGYWFISGGGEKSPAELGKVTLKSNGDEALSDESP